MRRAGSIRRAHVLRSLLALCLFGIIIQGLQQSTPRGELRDFGSFIASGRAASGGENPYGIYPLTFHVVLPGFDIRNPNLNPPVSLPLFQWLARGDPQRTFVGWWLFSLACYAAAIGLLAWRYAGRDGWLTTLWALSLAGLWDTLALGQIYLPLVLIGVGAWLLLERDRTIAAGLLIGVLVAMKPNFAVWPAVLLLAGHARVSIVALLTALFLAIVPTLTLGSGVYADWFALILGDRQRAGFLTNASLPGLFHRAGAPAVGAAISLGLLIAAAGWAVKYRPSTLRASEIGITAGILASPIAWVHYTLFLLPVFFSRLVQRPSGLLLISAALLVIPVIVPLQQLQASLWTQMTLGSIYNWAVIVGAVALAPLALAEVRVGGTTEPASNVVHF